MDKSLMSCFFGSQCMAFNNDHLILLYTILYTLVV